MGIRGLIQYLRENILIKPEYTIPKGSTLIIDGNGWCCHFLDSLITEFREFGGFYDVLDKAIKEEVKRLTQDFKFSIIVYFDGKASAFKDLTAKKRSQDENDT